MAICKNGVTGHFSGKIAQVIARKIGNKTILQSVPKYKNRKKSVLQQSQETALSILSTSYTKYYPTVFDRLMSNNYRNEPPFNWFIRHNCALFQSDYESWEHSIILSNNRLPSCFFTITYDNSGPGSFIASHQGLIFNYVSSSVVGYLVIWDEQLKRFYVKDFGNVWQVFEFAFSRAEFELPQWRTYFFAFFFHDLKSGFTSKCDWFKWGSIVPSTSFEWLITGLRMQPKNTYNFIVNGVDFNATGFDDLKFVVDLPLFPMIKNSTTSFSYMSTPNPYDVLLFGTVDLPPQFPSNPLLYMCQPLSSSTVLNLSIVTLFSELSGPDQWFLREGIHFYVAGKMSQFVNCFAVCNDLFSPVFTDSKLLFNFDFRELWFEDSEPLEVIITVTYSVSGETFTASSSIMLYP